MDTTQLLIVVAVIVLVIVALGAWVAARRRRSKQLQERFGPEYERTVRETGDRRRAEEDLASRAERRDKLDIRPLPAERREHFAQAWRSTQADFVDSPDQAIRTADGLVMEVMRERGYPMDDFDQRAADISVEHPEVVEDYRTAHAITLAHEREEATTEELRRAMVHYRSLFDRLLSEGQTGREATRS